MEVDKIVQQSSVEFSKNAKGMVQFSIKVYHEDPKEALKKAMEIGELAEQYVHAKNPK